MGLGAAVIGSALIVNPWIGKFYRGYIVNFQDVMLTYFIWALASGLVMLGLGWLLSRFHSGRLENAGLLIITCLLILLSDRLLLAYLGLPPWMPDIDREFKHRPNIVRTWGPSFDHKLLHINEYGQHDDPFPLAKGANEIRGLIIGDSVSMGHGVTRAETFTNQLERMLNQESAGKTTYQIINAGVQGYTTFQEYHQLLESLVFEPDFIILGFCMNDLANPSGAEERISGVGLRFHGIILASSPLISYLVNETGYGRLLQIYFNRHMSLDLINKLVEEKTAMIARSSTDDPKYAKNWQLTLNYLEKIYRVAQNRDSKMMLLIFPYATQLMDPGQQKPQQILARHAESFGVDVLDFTGVFEGLIFQPDRVQRIRASGRSHKAVIQAHRAELDKYFLDSTHFTVAGHRVVASGLFDFLKQQDLRLK